MFASTNIVLVGLPGSGKTTVGQLLAQVLDLRFHDSDAQIVSTLGMPISEIITHKGEAFFRHHEALTCSTLLQHGEGVFALGAGAILHPEIARLLPLHTVVYLKSGLSTLGQRLGLQTAQLGLLKALEAERVPSYERLAKFTIETDRLNPAAVARGVMELTGISEEVF